MWESLLDRMLAGLIRKGTLDLTMPDGRRRSYGAGAPEVALRLTDPDLPRRLVLSPDIALGEGYMDGAVQIEGDDLHGLLAIALGNIAVEPSNWRDRALALGARLRPFAQVNPVARARRNVAHHYDLSDRLYRIFLDRDMQYSCAYFRDPAMTLDEAQAAKKAHIAAKLLIEPGMRILDIGCGWGGMALTLARDHGARVVGVTLSEEQHRVASGRARAAGLADRVEFRLEDYRVVTGQFDRIVSVGMFEHVGAPQYREYFQKISQLLVPDGVALVHSIGRASPPGATSPWITKYIFPGGYCPSLSEMMAAVELEGLYETDVEIWRLHYAQTLRQWHDRFQAGIDEARRLYDDRFCRMWRYYLVASEMTFRLNRQCVFQVQLAHRQEAVPLTRDYLYPPRPVLARMQVAE